MEKNNTNGVERVKPTESFLYILHLEVSSGYDSGGFLLGVLWHFEILVHGFRKYLHL